MFWGCARPFRREMNHLKLVQPGEPTMTSLELVDFINEDRKRHSDEAGAPFPSKEFAKLEHSDFLKKVPLVLGEKVAGNFSCYYKA